MQVIPLRSALDCLDSRHISLTAINEQRCRVQLATGNAGVDPPLPPVPLPSLPHCNAANSIKARGERREGRTGDNAKLITAATTTTAGNNYD